MLTLDVGTSSARVRLYGADGRAVEGLDARAPVAWDEVDGGFQADADALVELVAGILDRGVREAGERRRAVAAVALSTFWHSLLGIDASGRPVTPLLPWIDARSRSVLADLRAVLDEDAVRDRTGAPLHHSYLPAKILWLRREWPDRSALAARWVSFGEYLLLRLFGRALGHVSMASGTGLFDIRRRRWDPEVLAGIEVAPETLPLPGDTRSAPSGLREPFASRWPPLAAIPWFGPFGDGGASNVGVGCLTRDRLALMIGTSGALRLAWSGDEVTIPPGLWCYRVDERRLVMGGALSNGGNLYEWLTSHLAVADLERLDMEVAGVAPDGHGLTVLPFWAGERSPDYPDDARGVISGLTFETSPVEIVRAVMEAVAYRFATLYRLIRPHLKPDHTIVATGGALVRSEVWPQILADVLDQPIVKVDVPEASSRGAALLALEALGIIDDAATVPVPEQRRYTAGEATRAYTGGFARHKRLYDHVSSPGA